LVIHRTFIDGLIVWATSWFLQSIQDIFKSLWPGPFLPDCVILKIRKPEPEWEAEWDNERRMYKRLENLQGSFIPILYGEADYGGQPALVLSYIHGLPLFEVTGLTVTEVRRKLKEAFLPLQQHGVYQDDPTMANLILVDGERLVTIDLERVYEPTNPDKIGYLTKDSIHHILHYFFSGPVPPGSPSESDSESLPAREYDEMSDVED